MNEPLIKLRILGVTFSQVQAGAYAILLAEEDGPRRIPIIIGTPEAQSIAIHLEGLTPPRPLTHDLFISFVMQMRAEISSITIYRYDDGVFYSHINLVDENENAFEIDSRTSDAIAIAIRSAAPIYTTPEIIQRTGLLAGDGVTAYEETDSETPSEDPISYENMTLEELKAVLDQAINEEDYERASHIRDIIRNKS
ncbi:DUF151 domain-containing protein [Bacteroidales bacterium OttesenSCG-928-J19]|nr:DUF151 domain-containing protein [Bacteroidales bacterium OttesenSCG-928-J19]